MKKGDELELSISELSSEGMGIAKIEDNFVIFIPQTLPGDRVIAQINKKKSNYAEAKLVELLDESPDRVAPYSMHFGVCGGCKIQNFAYNKQLEFKTNVVKNAFLRIGEFDNIEVNDCLASPEVFYYRNKMEFSFSDDVWLEDPSLKGTEKFALGLHVPKFHSKILNIKYCFLQSEQSNKILNFTRDFFKERGTSIYSTKTHSGYLRFLIIRQSKHTPDLMVNLITENYDEELIKEYANALRYAVPEITTIINAITSKKAQVAFGEQEFVIYGDGVIYEKLTNLNGNEHTYKISANSFFQTNTLQAENLFNIGMQYGDFNGKDNVIDLYCGAGSISLFISDSVKYVKGVELVADAIANANKNKKLNGVANCDFELSDIKDFLKSSSIEQFNKIILDPPRAGLHPEICEILSETRKEKIVYISCNPSTQARDLKIICNKGNYKLGRIQPVDMFPHTYHVENVVEVLAN
ncbi:MAG TPA: 23S rRNA (uracil(1939)-C(5))-methyltransferase RlmD [Ignavibacteria bacterium]|nr:23S rRNA (uracil(1939)-C(5))-methyltransferase RlmD [Ignavibacteria bacterium]